MFKFIDWIKEICIIIIISYVEFRNRIKGCGIGGGKYFRDSLRKLS